MASGGEQHGAAAQTATNAAGKRRVALVLQGGGALGAYHVGAYQALHEAGHEPDWLVGISIGAINACILADHEPAERLAALETLWGMIARPDVVGTPPQGAMRRLYNQVSFYEGAVFGQPHFWSPRFPSPLLFFDLQPEQASFYDTAPMRETLTALANFERINRRATRLSLGVTRIDTGELEFFDNTTEHQPLGPEHVLASGSLPPAFPPTRVEHSYYWDGACVSNTPLEAIYKDPGAGHTLVFMIDLWDAHGPVPRNMDEVGWRQKQILYASRSRHNIEALASRHNYRRALYSLAGRHAADIGAATGDLDLASHNADATFDIVHVIYHPAVDQMSDSDAEFSRASIEERRAAGYADIRRALAESPWLRAPMPAHVGTRVHTLRGGTMTSRHPF